MQHMFWMHQLHASIWKYCNVRVHNKSPFSLAMSSDRETDKQKCASEIGIQPTICFASLNDSRAIVYSGSGKALGTLAA